MKKNARKVDITIALAMIAALVTSVASTSIFDVSAEYETVNTTAKEIRILGEPFILFSTLSLLSVVAAILGGVVRILGWPYSKRVLILSALFGLASSPMVNVYVQNSITSASGFVFAVCLGVLIGRKNQRP